MPTVAFWSADVASRMRIAAALRADASVHATDDLRAVRELAAVPEVVGVILDPPPDARDLLEAVVRDLRARFPALPLIAMCELSPRSLHQSVSLVRAGVDGFVVKDGDDVGAAIRAIVDAARVTRSVDWIAAQLHPDVPGRVMPVLEFMIRHANQPLAVATVAHGLGVHRRTLVNRCATYRLPAPTVMISWCRLLLASWLLESPGRSVEQVAFHLGFGSGAALRNMLRRYAGITPRQLPNRGGTAWLLEQFRCALRAGPATMPRSPAPSQHMADLMDAAHGVRGGKVGAAARAGA